MRVRGLCRPRLVSALLVLTSLCLLWAVSSLRDNHTLVPHTDTALSQQQIQDAVTKAEIANAERLLRVQTVCRKYNLGLYRDSSAPPAFKQPPTPQYSVFYIDLAHKLSWCPVYKAASTSWLYNLCLLGGYKESELRETKRKRQLSTLARKVFPELDYPEAEEALQSTLKLLVVRHPFERILSAYRDKLENTQVGGEHGTVHFYRAYGSRIVAKYRTGGNQTHTRDLLRPGTYFWDSNLLPPAGVEPTFREFVRYLIDVDLLHYSDDHWIPVYLFCTPCLLRYDIIAKVWVQCQTDNNYKKKGKFIGLAAKYKYKCCSVIRVETLQQDQIYTLRAARVDHLVRPKWQHRTVPRGKTTSDIARMYFSQLTLTDVQKLYQKYQLDFELFGYDTKEYLKYAMGLYNAL